MTVTHTADVQSCQLWEVQILHYCTEADFSFICTLRIFSDIFFTSYI